MVAVVDGGTRKQCQTMPFLVSTGKLQTCLKVLQLRGTIGSTEERTTLTDANLKLSLYG